MLSKNKNKVTFKKNILTLASIMLLPSMAANAAVTYADVGPVIWEDNFDTFNSEHWNVDEGNGCAIGLCGWGNQELQSYSSGNVSIQSVDGEPGNNALVLEAKAETFDSRNFTSGKIQSENKIAIQYGLIEMRIKVPNLETGLWPAAWMLGTSTLPWPNKGEIDMMEMGHHLSHREGWLSYNNDPTDDSDAAPNMNNFTGSNMIFYAEGACSDGNPTCAASVAWQNDNAYVSAEPMSDRFVTYRTYWTAEEMRFTVVDNGVEYDVFESSFGLTGDLSTFQAPFYLLMNLAVGGTFTDALTDGEVTAPIPASMYIDYVRVYELDGQGSVTMGDQRPLQTGTFGVFTDESNTSNKLEPGISSEVYLWDPNSSEGTEAPYEGENAISWSLDNAGTWFGGGVQTYQALNMSNFEEGDLSFYIKIPADVSFRIGITDTYTNENWVTFPAGETTYGLVRNGEWGKATIPVSDIRGTSIALQSLQYPFAISSDAANLPASTFTYAIDDILWTGGGEAVDTDGDGIADDFDDCPNVYAITTDGCPDVTAVSIHIEAEDYDAFSDTGAGNNGNEYRDDDVDIQVTADESGEYNIGWTAAGEWLEYKVELVPGTYELSTRVASLPGGGAYTISVDGNPIVSEMVTTTGNWQTWQTQELGELVITAAGTYTLRIDITAGGFNLNYIDLDVDTTQVPVDSDGDGIIDLDDACPSEYAETADGCPEVIEPTIIRVEAEDYSAFSDTGAGNNGDEYRNDDVDIQVTGDSEGTYNVGWTDASEWLEYEVNLVAGTYHLSTRVASRSGGSVYSVSLDGSEIATDTISATGGWQTWETHDLGEFTTAISGEQTLRVNITSGGFNVNYFDITQVSIAPADSDNDGVNDDIDQCPNTATGANVDNSGCEIIITPVQLTGTASVSSALQSAANALDGNPSTRWESEHGIDPSWITIDLGASYDLTEVVIDWEAANASDYVIQGSNDNTSWQTLANVNGGSFGARTDANTVSGNYRYVRIYATSRSEGNQWGYSIYEIEVYGAENTASNNEVSWSNDRLIGGAGASAPGFTLYVFDNDVAASSNCYDNCAAAWPPLLVNDGVASGVEGLSTLTRTDGTLQAAHNDRPLYFYAGDTNQVDINGHGLNNLWWSISYDSNNNSENNTAAIEPLFSFNTPLEQETIIDRGDALVTRFADRGRDRHAKEDQFQAYDHYLSHYWTHRTAQIQFEDYVAKGGNRIDVTFITEWKLGATEFRAWYRGLGTVAEYHGNYGGNVVEVDSGSYDHNFNKISDDGDQYRYTLSINEYRPLSGEFLSLESGQRMEIEISQFLDGVPEGRENYYGTTYLYIVGEGFVPWYTQGDFADPTSLREDSFPIAESAWLGGTTTLPYAYTNEPDNHFMQMATNLSNINGQAFVLGRRLHHTNFITGEHDESVDNGVFTEMIGKGGSHYVNTSCANCHERNGRAAPTELGEQLNKWVFKVAQANGEPDLNMGSVLQPNNTFNESSDFDNTTHGEGSVVLSSWTEQNGLRSPNYSFSRYTPELFSARIAPQLVGLGLLEAIDENTILAFEDVDDTNNDGISGKAQRIADPLTGETRLGRFGWKAATTSLHHQVAGALNTDMGVMTSVLPNPDCGANQTSCGNSSSELSDEHLTNLVKYIALLGVRAQRDAEDQEVIQGQALFNDIGCNSCHIDTLTTSEFHPYTELRNQTIHPYTDLLVHDMGEGLADNLGEGDATGREWRTTPLWGIGLSACVTGGVINPLGGQGNEECSPVHSYLHDGRARTIEEAILWHGGESQNTNNAYQALSASDKAALLSFLNSL